MRASTLFGAGVQILLLAISESKPFAEACQALFMK